MREISALEGEENNSPIGIDLAKELESYERDIIRSALMEAGGRQNRAARLLNVKATTLHAKIKRYRILEEAEIEF